jgi:putative endonuclease
MLTNRSRTVLYTGVTNSLERRIWFHRHKTIKSFTKRYRIDRLFTTKPSMKRATPSRAKNKSKAGGAKRRTI